MTETFDTLKQAESNTPDLNLFTVEQTDAVIVYLAKIARTTLEKHGLSKEQRKSEESKFMKILDSWPKDFRQRVMDRVINVGCDTKRKEDPFWAMPADAIIEATKSVEFKV